MTNYINNLNNDNLIEIHTENEYIENVKLSEINFKYMQQFKLENQYQQSLESGIKAVEQLGNAKLYKLYNLKTNTPYYQFKYLFEHNQIKNATYEMIINLETNKNHLYNKLGTLKGSRSEKSYFDLLEFEILEIKEILDNLE